MKATMFFFLSLFLMNTVFAQTSKTKAADRADYAAFKKQIMALPEYQQEKKKTPKMKQGSVPVKITVAIETDSTNQDEATNVLTGYIKEDNGTTSEPVFEIQFDRITKTITSVKSTGDGFDTKDGDEDEKPAHKKGKDSDNDGE